MQLTTGEILIRC